MEMDRKIAVMIDADNVSPKYIKYILDEIATYGTPTYKRIYGDWTKPQLVNWKSELLEYSIIPIQQYSYTTGKNSTDSALIIDAMDILYSGNVDGFCIVSSDSDFTRLVTRLREDGRYVVGMGEKKTPRPFVVACEKFIYLETIAEEMESSENDAPVKMSTPIQKDKENTAKLCKAVRKIVMEISDDDGWAYIGNVGNILSKRYPDFDVRNYGFHKLTPLLDSLGPFEVTSRRTSNPHVQHKYIRLIPASEQPASNQKTKKRRK